MEGGKAVGAVIGVGCAIVLLVALVVGGVFALFFTRGVQMREESTMRDAVLATDIAWEEATAPVAVAVDSSPALSIHKTPDGRILVHRGGETTEWRQDGSSVYWVLDKVLEGEWDALREVETPDPGMGMQVQR